MTVQGEFLHQARLTTARRIVAQFAGGKPDWAEAAMVNEARVYTDPARHAQELEALFRRTPVIACLSSDLPEAGSFLLFEQTGLPILIVRGKDGAVRAFLNICGHRGAPLVQQAAGRASRFTCLFHAWTYSSEGKLAGVPGREGFEGCLEGRDLTPVPAAERHGVVFVQATPGRAALDLEAHLGAFGPQLAMLELEGAARLKSDTLSVAANWKYVLDTYGEGYHFASLHRDTIAPNFRADVQVYDRYGAHHKINWAARPMADWAGTAEADWGVDDRVGWVHYIFPNSVIFFGSVKLGMPIYTLYQIFPGATPGETTTVMTTYTPGGAPGAAERAELEAVHDATVHIVSAEDYAMAAAAWANLAHDPGRTVVFGRQEVALQNVHRAILARIGVG